MAQQLNLQNLTDQTYDILKNMILRRSLAPSEKIHEKEISKKIGVSRTPLRAALVRLESEGLVKILPRRGAYVAHQSKSKVVEIVQIREVLEGLLVRLVAHESNPGLTDKLKACLERIQKVDHAERSLMDYTKAETEFHALLLNACPNRMLRNLIKKLNMHLQLIRLRTVTVPGRADRTIVEHGRIVEAMERGDERAAEWSMRQHIASVLDVVNNDLGPEV